MPSVRAPSAAAAAVMKYSRLRFHLTSPVFHAARAKGDLKPGGFMT